MSQSFTNILVHIILRNQIPYYITLSGFNFALSLFSRAAPWAILWEPLRGLGEAAILFYIPLTIFIKPHLLWIRNIFNCLIQCHCLCTVWNKGIAKNQTRESGRSICLFKLGKFGWVKQNPTISGILAGNRSRRGAKENTNGDTNKAVYTVSMSFS